MQIGTIRLENPVICAPMAGITDKAFREILKEMGAGLVFTEMVSDKSLVYLNKHAYEIIDIKDELRPIAVQIFGSEPDFMARAAQIVENAGADILDINMGCPTPKIVKNGEGAAMLLDLNNTRRILRAVKQAVKIPVTVKTRKGWDDKNPPTAVALAKIAEEEGASAITIHGRTREQFYSGKADWAIIKAVKEEVKIPVIGNGDIFSPQDAQNMMRETGCDAIMIARGMLGNPWLIERTVKYLDEGILLPEPTVQERIVLAISHLKRVCALKGEEIGVKEMRKHLAWYLKGMRGAARLRDELNRLTAASEVERVLREIL